MSDELKPFEREERYIVIKRKYLEPDQESDLRMFLSRRRIGTVECAVVESDWPEYEAVWKMIEDRVSGRPPSPTAEAVREACAKVAENFYREGDWLDRDHAGNAITAAIRAIHAMPLPQAETAKVEPVAWLYAHGEGGCRVVTPLTERAEHMKERGWTETPLIPAPKGQSDE